MNIEMGTCEQPKLKVPRVLRYWPPESRSCSMRSERLWSTQDRRPHLQSLSMPFNRARCCKNHFVAQFARFQFAKSNQNLHRETVRERFCMWRVQRVPESIASSLVVSLQLEIRAGGRAGVCHDINFISARAARECVLRGGCG